MMRPACVALLLLTPALLCHGQLAVSGTPPGVVEVVRQPDAVRLSGPQASYSLLVHGKTADGRWLDLTREARFQSLKPSIASVTPAGVVHAQGDGTTSITVEALGHKRTVTVEVKDSSAPRAFHFENDIVPVLSRHGCNAAGCHGSALGQNGFKLSVFGSDPPADYAALVKEGRGRRVLFASPENSLMLAKPSGAVAHG